MKTLTRVAAAAVVLALGSWFLLSSQAGEDKAAKDDVLKIAAAHQKGDEAGAKKMAAATAKKVEEIDVVMKLLKPRTKGGLGVGDKPGAITPDGIELKLTALGRDSLAPGAVAKEAEALAKMAYETAAVMDVALAKTPEKDEGKKTRKLWTTTATEAHDAALELAKAAHAKSAAAIKTAAAKVNAGCNNCHSEYR